MQDKFIVRLNAYNGRFSHTKLHLAECIMGYNDGWNRLPHSRNTAAFPHSHSPGVWLHYTCSPLHTHSLCTFIFTVYFQPYHKVKVPLSSVQIQPSGAFFYPRHAWFWILTLPRALDYSTWVQETHADLHMYNALTHMTEWLPESKYWTLFLASRVTPHKDSSTEV